MAASHRWTERDRSLGIPRQQQQQRQKRRRSRRRRESPCPVTVSDLVPKSKHSTSEKVMVNPACHSEYTVRAHGLKISSDVGGFGSGLWDASYHRILHVHPRKRGAEEHCEKIPLVPIFWNRKQNVGTLGIHAKHSQHGPPGLTVPPSRVPAFSSGGPLSCRWSCRVAGLVATRTVQTGVYIFGGWGSRFWVLTLP